MSSLADETPEGRSIVVLAKQYGIREHAFTGHEPHFVPFTAQTRMSGVDFNGTRLRKGAGDAILRWVADEGGQAPPELRAEAEADRPAKAARRWRSPATRRSSAWSDCTTSSRTACASASTSSAPWGSRRSWSRATTP